MNYLLLVVQQLIAASTHLVAKSVTVEVHPTTVVLIRGVFACLAYAIWWLIRRRSLPKIDRADIPMILLLGLINIPINQLLFVWGVKYTTAPNASLAYALTPAFAVIFLALVLKHKPTRKSVIGIAIAIVGTVVVLMDRGAGFVPEQTLGNLMVLCAAISWSVFTVLGRVLVAKYGAIYAIALTFFAGLVFYIPLFFIIPVPFDVEALLHSPHASALWMQLGYLGIITSGFGFALWYYALTHMDASRVSVFNNLQPIFTTLLALAIFGTEPTLAFLIGGSIALVGVIITQRG